MVYNFSHHSDCDSDLVSRALSRNLKALQCCMLRQRKEIPFSYAALDCDVQVYLHSYYSSVR